MRSYLSEDDRIKISEAIARAETKTNGEIVPCVIQSSGHYREIFWKSVALGALFTAIIVGALDSLHYLGWTNFQWMLAILISLAGGLCTYVIAHFSGGFSRILVGQRRLRETVERRAKELFLDYELFRTKERTGILILVSLFERQVVVLGDTAIHQKVQSTDWNNIVQTVVSSIRERKLVMGLVQAVDDSQKLLERHGFIERVGSNELPNDVLGDR